MGAAGRRLVGQGREAERRGTEGGRGTLELVGLSPALESPRSADIGDPMVLTIFAVVLCVLGFPVAVATAYFIDDRTSSTAE
jgi:hypothetical protein